MTGAVLAMLLSLGVAAEDRGPELAAAKREQSETIATSIATVASRQRSMVPRELAAVLVALGWHESKFALRIAEGRCKPWECDRGKARGIFQIHRRDAMSDAQWDALLGTGTEPTLASTREIARRVIAARKRCRSLEARQDWAAGVFSSLAGRGCIGEFKGRAERVRVFRRLLAVRG
jgi:hypothetical protein